MKIRPVGAELLDTDGRTDRHDGANSRFSQFCESAWNVYLVYKDFITPIRDLSSLQCWKYRFKSLCSLFGGYHNFGKTSTSLFSG